MASTAVAETDTSHRAARRCVPIYAALITGNLLAWGWAIAAFHGRPVLLGAAALAYVFGLRHAVDADHIAAIDNVTRKLVRHGRPPLSVGLYFSLGHSTVVVLACAGIALASVALKSELAHIRETGNLVGTLISAAFLMFIALANSVALVSLWRELRDVRAGRMRLSADSGSRGPQPGLMGRILRPLLRLVSRPRDMYLLGFLFGLGFDTASEIGLLGISAGQASQNAPLWSIMIFPALFTAGMSLVDTTDGVVMAGAYGWAYVDPARKLAYNLAVTFASVIVAVAVGGLEMLGLFAAQGSSRFWQGVAALNARSGMVGCAILAAALSCWLVSAFVYRLRRPTRRSIPAR